MNSGVSLEALCNTSAPPPDAVLVLCLKSIYALLAPTATGAEQSESASSEKSSATESDSESKKTNSKSKRHATSWAARVLVEERVLCVELVHVLYRVLLARDSSALHLLALEALICLLRALREQTREQRDDHTKSGDGVQFFLFYKNSAIKHFYRIYFLNCRV